MSDLPNLPKSWQLAPLAFVATINPPKGTIEADPNSPAHFVPMASVGEDFSGIDISATRPLKEVIKGYTAFREGDVLFAKITPCMENGKIAIVPPLDHGLGFGSTEFHVLRSSEVTLPDWIARYLSQVVVRRNAKRSMTGSAGQLRVPSFWLAEQSLPVPPLPEQRRIVAKIEKLFSDLDAGVAALERAKANLKRYRAAVLKAAVEGKLTEEWRADHPNTEPASKLLERILTQRRQNWEVDQLAKFAVAKKEPPKNWRAKYVEPKLPDITGLPDLPEGWCWASVEQCASEVTVGHVGPMKDEYVAEGIPFLRSQNVRPLRYDRVGLRYISDDFHNELKKSKLFGGELLVVRSGNIGEACVYPENEPEANCADLVITRLVTNVDAQYAATFVVSPLGQTLVGGKRTGSALSHFNVGAMANGPIPLPSEAEQAVIVRTVGERLSQIEAAVAEIDHSLLRAGRLRQSILKLAFEGKLVPQDPHDEPASMLLKRISASQSIPESNGKAITRVQTRGRRAKSK